MKTVGILPSKCPDPGSIIGLAALLVAAIAILVPLLTGWPVVALAGAALTISGGVVVWVFHPRFITDLVETMCSPRSKIALLGLLPCIVAIGWAGTLALIPSRAAMNLPSLLGQLEKAHRSDELPSVGDRITFDLRTTTETRHEPGAPHATINGTPVPQLVPHPDLTLHVAAPAITNVVGVPIGTMIHLDGVLENATRGDLNDVRLLLSDCKTTIVELHNK